MRKDSFLRGAFILMVGSLVSRVLGAVYRFILPWLMGGGDEGAYGMALFALPYSIYSIALVLSSMGIPLAISKLVSAALADNSPQEARRVFRVSVGLLFFLGAAFSVVLYFASPYFAHRVWQNPDAYYSMVALAPAVAFVSVMSALRGLFQGLQNMTPHAASQIIEQIVRVGTMFALVAVLVPYGLEYAAAGATFGATTGAVAGVLYLLAVYWRNRQDMWGIPTSSEIRPSGRSTWAVIKDIMGFAIPISITGVIMPLMRFVDAAVVPSRLISAGLSEALATTNFGYLEAYSMPFVNAPAIFTTAVAISLGPSVSESMARGDLPAIRSKFRAALRIATLIGVPAGTGLLVLSSEIPDFFWSSPQAGPVLASVAGVAVFFCLQQVSSAVLQGLGLPQIPMRNLLFGAVVKLGMTWMLTGMPEVGVRGAGYASVVGFGIAAVLNIASVLREVGAFSVVGATWRPVAASAIMGVIVRASSEVVVGEVGLTLGFPLAVVTGVVIYGLTILLIGGVRTQDLQMIPRVGGRLAGVLKSWHLLRD